MKYNYKGFMKKAFSYIVKARMNSEKLNVVDANLRVIINQYDDITRNEKYELLQAFYKVYRAIRKRNDWKRYLSLNKNYDFLIVTCRNVMKKRNLRIKRNVLKESMQEGNVIFYICSKHSEPALDHKDYQGKIYVDRFWKTKTDNSMHRAISSYIKNHQVETVQNIMSAPVYLTTRPYCKHYFIPADTQEVLSNSYKKIVNSVGIQRTSNYNYYDTRKEIFEKIWKIAPCKEFLMK